MKDVKGVIIPLVSLDDENLIKLLDYVSSVDFVFVLGSTGEFDKQTDSEKERIVKTTLEHSKKPILVGCSDKDSDKVIKNINKFSEAYALVVAPNPNEDVSEFYDKILENTSEDILLYNNPGNPAIGQSIPFEVIERLSKHERIIGIKDSMGDINFFKRLLELKSENFRVLQGDETLYLESLKLGADGIVSSTANLDPELLMDLFNKREEELQEKLNSLHFMYKNSEKPVDGLKNEMKKRGIIR
ncbi:dihydrodipicolinate synthase family protein [Nanoarchaeota archaeon]